MDPRTVRQRREELQILDVRDDEEWAAGRIEGAVHIPLSQLSAHPDGRPGRVG
jgi:rhodanese-related sulfurtransferase